MRRSESFGSLFAYDYRPKADSYDAPWPPTNENGVKSSKENPRAVKVKLHEGRKYIVPSKISTYNIIKAKNKA